MQDEVHFRKAILNFSSSPYCISVTVIDTRKAKSRSFCVETLFLLGALHHELDVGYDLASQKKISYLAISNKTRVFSFLKQEALNNMPMRYTEAELDEARKMINLLGSPPPAGPISGQFGQLNWSPALACALIEKGLSARRADLTGLIFAEP
jgi:hypothetical protein